MTSTVVIAWWCQRGDRCTIVEAADKAEAGRRAAHRLRSEPTIVRKATTRQREWWDWALAADTTSCRVAEIPAAEQTSMFGTAS